MKSPDERLLFHQLVKFRLAQIYLYQPIIELWCGSQSMRNAKTASLGRDHAVAYTDMKQLCQDER